MKYTLEQIKKWIQETEDEGVEATNIILPMPEDEFLRLGEVEINVDKLEERYCVGKLWGLEIWVDDELPPDKGYIIDKNSYFSIERSDSSKEVK